jgi:hypothetical protein
VNGDDLVYERLAGRVARVPFRAPLAFEADQLARLVLARLGADENDGLRWPRRDGLKWPRLASVVVGVDLA